jgi:hypothetical protein
MQAMSPNLYRVIPGRIEHSSRPAEFPEYLGIGVLVWSRARALIHSQTWALRDVTPSLSDFITVLSLKLLAILPSYEQPINA